MAGTGTVTTRTSPRNEHVVLLMFRFVPAEKTAQQV